MKIEPYKTIKTNNEFQLKEKKSIFIAKAYPVSNEDDVNNILNDLKQKYYDASHRCYAYRLWSAKSKFSDAGEPSGTAGIKILNGIDHFKLHDCLVVVIRYFGGIKLGVGPLGKAYYDTVIRMLSKSNIIIKKPYEQLEIQLAISSIDKLNRILNPNKIIVTESNYDEETKIKCLIPLEIVNKVKTEITELLRGEVIFSSNNEVFFK